MVGNYCYRENQSIVDASVVSRLRCDHYHISTSTLPFCDQHSPQQKYFCPVCSYFWLWIFLFCIKRSFNISSKAGLVVVHSLGFCSSEKIFLSPLILDYNLAGYPCIQGCIFLSSRPLNTSCHFLLSSQVASEKSTDSLMGFSLYMTFFTFAAF